MFGNVYTITTSHVPTYISVYLSFFCPLTLECKEDFFLHEGQCTVACPDGFFEDMDQGVCKRCHTDCLLCDGPESTNCNACFERDSTLHNGACLAPCPSHTYRESRSRECMGETTLLSLLLEHCKK